MAAFLPRLFLLIVFVTVGIHSTRSQSLTAANFPSNRIPGNCGGNGSLYDCGGKCINFTSVRNCIVDCPDGSDEVCPTNFTLCDTLGGLCGQCASTVANTSNYYATVCQDQRYQRLCGQPSTIQCRNTTNCVFTDWILDGINDCFDNSDEDPCYQNRSNCDLSKATCTYTGNLTYKCNCLNGYYGSGQQCGLDPLLSRLPGNCSTNQFDCGNGACISATKLHDCIVDCSDGSDERCFQGTYECGLCGCINSSIACADNITSHILCTVAGAVSCRAKQRCVQSKWLRDGFNDCGDWSDEDVCFLGNYSCPTDSTCIPLVQTANYTCRCRNGATVLSGGVCSNQTNPNGTLDINQVLARIPGKCSSDPLQFDCYGDGFTCIPIAQFRDCVNNCPNGADEVCWPGTVSCGPCKCVLPSDYATVCPTNSSGVCGYKGLFACVNGQQCIDDSFVLDGTTQCTDGSDENYCSLGILSCPSANSPCLYSPPSHSFQCGCPTGMNATGGKCTFAPVYARDCADIQFQTGATTSKSYNVIRPTCPIGNNCLYPVQCDLQTNLGGWTIIQKRYDGSQDFFQSWSSYKLGFGSASTEFWLGNDFVQELTNRYQTPYRLLILLTDASNNSYQINYETIGLLDELTTNFTLTLTNFSSTNGAPDNLAASNGNPFGTYDVNTALTSINCGTYWQSGWWFDPYCGITGNLNLPMKTQTQYPYIQGVVWRGLKNALVKSTKMMIRPVGFEFWQTATTTAPTTSWNYDYTGPNGPPNWQSLSPSYTCNGTSQSPIVLQSKYIVTDQTIPPLIFVNYNINISSSVLISNIGYSVELNFGNVVPAPTVSGGNLGDTYELSFARFHWGNVDTVGAEHVMGKTVYPCEIQLFHTRQVYARNFSSAVNDPTGVVVVTILCQAGATNNNLQTMFFNYLSSISYKGQTTLIQNLILSAFLPNSTDNFLRYQGSMTYPPCTQNLIWVVFPTPLILSSAQIAAFRSLFQTGPFDTPAAVLLANYRPPQPIGGRIIYSRQPISQVLAASGYAISPTRQLLCGSVGATALSVYAYGEL